MIKLIFLYVLFLMLFFVASCSNQEISCGENCESLDVPIFDDDCVNKVCFDDFCYEVELPTTPEEFSQGLMFREFLPEDRGMLFAFQDEEKHAFWMKNTLIPLDMIWLNRYLEVVYIQEAVPCESDPCTIYAPDVPALYVLELNAGQSSKNNIFVGSNAELRLCSN